LKSKEKCRSGDRRFRKDTGRIQEKNEVLNFVIIYTNQPRRGEIEVKRIEKQRIMQGSRLKDA